MKSNKELLEQIENFQGDNFGLWDILIKVGLNPDSETIGTIQKKYDKTEEKELKPLLKSFLGLISPQTEFEPSGLIFPGNFTLDEIRKILPDIEDRVFKDMNQKWNRFEKNRVLNAVDSPQREKILKEMLPVSFFTGYFYEKEYKNFVQKLKLMETVGQIKIRENISDEVKAEYQSETINLYTADNYKKYFNKLQSRKQNSIPVNNSEIFELAPEIKSPRPKVYGDFFEALSAFQLRFGLFALEPHLHLIPDPLIRTVLKILIDGGNQESVEKMTKNILEKQLSDFEHFLNYFSSQIELVFAYDENCGPQSAFEAFYPNSTFKPPSPSPTSIKHEEKLKIWRLKLTAYHFRGIIKSSHNLRIILDAIYHYKLFELTPILQEQYQIEKNYNHTLKNFLEIMGAPENIEPSKMIFPKYFNLDEVKLIMSFLDEDSLKALTVRWNLEERNKILNAVDDPEVVFNHIQPRLPNWMEGMNFKNARKKLKEVISTLVKAGKISIKKEIPAVKNQKDFYSELMQKVPQINPIQSSSPEKEDIQKLLESAQKLPASPLPDIIGFQSFIEEVFDISREQGLMALEDYLPLVKDKILRMIIQCFIDGADSDIVIGTFVQSAKKRLMGEFRLFTDYLEDCFRIFLDGEHRLHYQTNLYAYFPDLMEEEEA